MGLLLEKTPYRVLLASNKLAVLHTIRYLKPDLLIAHDQSPTRHGSELADQLHAMRGFEAGPIMVLGSHFSIQEYRRNMVRLSDPLDLDCFLLIIESILTHPSLPRYGITENVEHQRFYAHPCGLTG